MDGQSGRGQAGGLESQRSGGFGVDGRVQARRGRGALDEAVRRRRAVDVSAKARTRRIAADGAVWRDRGGVIATEQTTDMI